MNQNQVLQEFVWLFLGCLAAATACAGFAYILIWRRNFWLRLLDAEEAFWMRFGLPKGGAGRRFAESRFFTISFVLFAVGFLFLALSCVAAYFYFRP